MQKTRKEEKKRREVISKIRKKHENRKRRKITKSIKIKKGEKQKIENG